MKASTVEKLQAIRDYNITEMARLLQKLDMLTKQNETIKEVVAALAEKEGE